MENIRILDGCYSATSCGKIFSHISGRFLTQSFGGAGYLYVKLKDRKHHLVSRLVLMAHGVDIEGLTANHKDGDKTNNAIDNLEAVTLGNNIRHAFRSGLQTTNSAKKLEALKITQRNRRALNTDDVLSVFSNKGVNNINDIAANFGVSRMTISRIWNGSRYADITGATS